LNVQIHSREYFNIFNVDTIFVLFLKKIHCFEIFRIAVLWLPMGTWKGRYWMERGKKDDILRHVGFRILESLLIQIKAQGDKQAVVIFGMEELTYYKVAHLEGKNDCNHFFKQIVGPVN